ncbi:energy transducer TonB [Pedobacter sp. SD-b]|uniref:Energy transducer TonB n=1 Tax=Pedobacter segetis TaxID=2793069 RepID=A0ABS1BGY6_9SPHI|nr:energy transducer TonB [Pedobacter segetis]MBK0382092.1 energy transducer TonB [Pedobacter segetis]
MRKLYILIILIIFCLKTHGQQLYSTTYLKFNNIEVDSANLADYTRYIYYTDSTKKKVKIIEKYKNGNLKQTGEVSEASLPFPNYIGVVNNYYDDGTLKSELTYYRGSLKGPATYYAKNGSVLSKGEYVNHYTKSYFKAHQLYNTKNENILDQYGNGILYTEQNFTTYHGAYKNGFKDGKWKIVDKRYKNEYDEVYKNGKLKGGSCTDVNGNKRTYDYIQTYPYFDGAQNMKDFGENSWEPISVIMKSNDLEGAVAYSFDIDKYGRLSNFKLLKSLSEYSDKKALDYIKRQKWHPASYMGITTETHGFIFTISYRAD